MSQLRLLCFNIHGGRGQDGKRNLARINALMDEHEIDIGVFQEIETRASRAGHMDEIDVLSGPARPYHLHGPTMRELNGGWYGNLIVSRYPILRGIVHNLGTRVNYEPRAAVDALIETPKGKIRLIGTHLSLASLERWKEANNLLKLIESVEETEKNPLFLMGDINEWRGSAKLLKYLNQMLIPVATEPSFPSFRPFLRLDRVWYDTPDLQVNCTTLKDKSTRKISDHLPLKIEIDFPINS